VKLAIVAGEASGDLHASEVVRELKKLDPSLETFGIGGDLLAAEGMRVLHHAREMGIVGLFNVLRHLGMFRRILRETEETIARERPDAVMLVDYPDFNLRLARRCKALGLRVIYYISPQVWAWRRGRVKQIARVVDRMLVIFPFEEELYRSHDVPVTYVGHPLIDEMRPSPAASRHPLPQAGEGPRAPALAPQAEEGPRPPALAPPAEEGLRAPTLAPQPAEAPRAPALAPQPGEGPRAPALAPQPGEGPRAPALAPQSGERVALSEAKGRVRGLHIALLPGSRRHEIRSLLPPMLDAMDILKKTHEVDAFVIQAPTIASSELLAIMQQSGTFARIVPHDTGASLSAADIALSSSGTATLECAIAGVPVVVMYRLSSPTHWLAQRLVKLSHFSLVNIVAGKTVVPELLQHDVNGARIAREVERLVEPAENERVRGELAEVTRKLGSPGASRRAAEAIMSAVTQ
jgi:lipid-A-disaccharide synthase